MNNRIIKAPSCGSVTVLIMAWALSKTECGVDPNSSADDVVISAECAEQIFNAIAQKIPALSSPLNVKESGATLRFVMPVLGALGLSADIIMEGRLPERPMEALTTQLR